MIGSIIMGAGLAMALHGFIRMNDARATEKATWALLFMAGGLITAIGFIVAVWS